MKLLALFVLLSNFLIAQQSMEPQLSGRFLNEISKSTRNVSFNLDDVKLQSAHISKNSGIQHAYLIQTINGIPIRGTESSIHLTQNGNLLQLNNKFIDETRSVKNHSPTLSALQALQSACHQLSYSQVSQFHQVESKITDNKQYTFNNPLISNSDIPVKLVYFIDLNKQIQLAWDLSIEEVGGMNWWSIIVNAATGTIIEQNNWMHHCNFSGCGHSNHTNSITNSTNNWIPGKQQQKKNSSSTSSYRVFELPLRSPADGSRSLINIQSNSASPFGWHDTSNVSLFTITRGNNVHAYKDDGTLNGYSPDGGASLNFDFSLDLTQPPAQNLDAGLTNLFYTSNKIHDILHANGFDEAAGNCQMRNYTGQGEDGDYVRVIAQYGNSCNASFAAPPDGASPIMHNWICNGRDGDFSNIVIAHEYAHGLSHRLTGGATNSNCLSNHEQMGEGWSDYLGILLTMKQGDVAADARPIASWFLNKPNGIRAYPYSTDMSVNPITYDRIRTMSIPYGTGLNWCTMLWEMTWGLIDQHGWDADLYNGSGGNNMALELVIEGLKLQPCRPGFVDGRDAILAADVALYGGANQCIIWQAFAKRGLGECADQGLSTDKTDGKEGFRLPASCGGTVCDVTASGNTEYNATWIAGQNVLLSHSVSGNAAWYATTDASWITLNTASGNGSGSISFDYTENNTLLDRVGFIKVSCDSLCFLTFKVTQGVQSCTQNFAQIPYYVDFETGVFDQYWCSISTEQEGNIKITTQHNPISANHLTLDAGGSNTKNVNAASVGVRLQGYLGVSISFDWKEFNNENNLEDGVFFSDNGGDNFVKVYNLINGQSTYQTVNLDISQLVAAHGLTLTNSFVIRFQQAGTDSIPDDGIAIDNILIKSSFCPAGIPCNDNDNCTINDTYDGLCVCIGILLDADNDGVCDSIDICPGGDDNQDMDGDGIPDFCDTYIACNTCDTPINFFPHTENFESGVNDICQFSGDGFDWTLNTGNTQTNGTGPSSAYEGNWYFYTEANSNKYKTAAFQGACYDFTNLNSASLDFWYHMKGTNVGSLNLEVSIDTGRTWTSVWSAIGYQGTQWNYKLVDITSYTGQLFTYRFVTTIGNHIRSDIALDLITVNNTSTCTPGSACNDFNSCTINDVYDIGCNCKGVFQDQDMDGVCDLFDICPGSDDNIDLDGDGTPDGCDTNGISCVDCSSLITTYPHTEDFEVNFNGICQYSGDDFNWSVHNGSTPTNLTGPSSAFQGANYFYTESSYPNAPNKVAAFQSGCYAIPASGNYQLEFWYHMFGSSIGTIDFDITIDTGRTWINHWTRSGDQGNQWNHQLIDLSSFSGERISYRFMATTGGVTSDFALDSVTINLIPTCAGNSCNDGDPCTINDVYDNVCNCIGTFQDTDMDNVCDANDLCPGYDDNKDLDGDGIPDDCDPIIECNDCSAVISSFPHTEDFEAGLNDICQFTGDDFDWTIHSGPTTSSYTGPNSAFQGVNYFFTESSSPNAPYKTAAFQSGCYAIPLSGNYQMDFWYHFYGATIGTINLDVTIDTGRTWMNLWTKSGDQGNQWSYQSIDLSSYSGERLSYRFVATTSYSTTSDFALDSITINLAPTCVIGNSCNDGDACTINDVLDTACNCIGTFQDTDMDSVCDANDLCPGFDDNIDVDGDGIPDDCDPEVGCNDCSTVVTVYPHIVDFESAVMDVCQYTGDDIDWNIQSGQTPSSSTGPHAAYQGLNYFYIESSGPNNPYKKAIFQGSCFEIPATGTCQLDFWYHMYGLTMGTIDLEITIDTGRTWTSAWSMSGNQGTAWHYQLIDLSSFAGKFISYRFVAATGPGSSSDFALDSITISHIPACVPGNACNDGDACTVNDVLDASCNCSGTFQDSDQDSVCDANDLCPGFDDSIDVDNDGIPDDCDSSIGCNDCNTVINSFPHAEDFELAQTEICQYQGDNFDWILQTGPTPSNNTGPTAAYQGQRYFYAESNTPNNPSKIATFQSGCYDIPATGKYQLDFWYHMYGSTMGTLDLEITIDTGRTWINLWSLSGSQGNVWQYQLVDLSSYYGQRLSYRFTGTTSTGSTSDFALDSITIDLKPLCVVGNSCNDGDPCTINDMFDTSCNCLGTFQDTDMDNVCDANDICPGYNDHLDFDQDGIPNGCDNNTSCQNCNVVINSFPHAEDFEPNTHFICQYDGDDFDWTVKTGSTHTNSTGPSAAFQGDNYFFTESSNPNHPDKIAAFQSGCYDLTQNGIGHLDFWYHMYGATMGTIMLEVSIDTGAVWTPIWSLTGDQGNQWNYHLIDLTPYVGNLFTYRFIAATTTGPTSDFALDSITVDFTPICTAGTPCNDSDSCTINDILDVNCNCTGTFQDTDLDSVCDAQDICPGHDDTIDDDGDGIPNGCDSVMTVNIELTQELQFSVYPNPFSDVLSIEISHQNSSPVLGQLELVDLMGRVILKQQEEWSTSYSTQFSLKNLANGVYYVKYWDEKHKLVKKVVKVQ